MGPPPPPPPPPVLQPSAPLPSGGWKTANAPRRDNNAVSAPPVSSRPRVDSAALQHAAARLRKTGYNEQIRGDVPNLSDGRVDRPNQHVSVGDRPNRSQQQQLDINQAGEQVHAATPRSYHTDSLSHVHRYPNQINNTTVSPPLSTNSFDSTPKNLYKTFNNPSSNTYIEKTLESPQKVPYSSYSSVPQSSPLSSHNNSYSQLRETTTTRTTTVPSHPTVSPYSTVPPPSTVLPYSTVPPPSTVPPYSTVPPQAAAPSNNYSSSSYTRTDSTYNTPRETSYEWTSPYQQTRQPVQPVLPSQPILDPRSRIHEFATRNFVNDESSQQYSPVQTKVQTTNKNTNSLAREIRDQGLTSSQKQANQFQQSQKRNDGLPFDVNDIYKKSYRGDEVDQLVTQMQTNLQNGQRTNVMQRSNICVACHSEITADKPGCTALDQVFHVACFNCKRCGKVLAGTSFYNIENDPICENCYQDSLDKCTKCGKTINDKLLRACGGTFHVDCFTCVSCRKNLDGIPFTVDSENQVHCVPCFHEKFAPRCAICSKAIIPVEGEKESVRVVAMDKSFHVECYRCEDCGLQLSSKIEGQGCYPLDSHLYCKTCNSNRLRMLSAA